MFDHRDAVALAVLALLVLNASTAGNSHVDHAHAAGMAQGWQLCQAAHAEQAAQEGPQ